MFAPVAAADGLVIESAASAHAVGDVIETGGQLSIAPGERVVVLDETGELASFTASGAYGLAEAVADDGGLSAIDAAFNAGQRADIGGTRTEDYEACLENAEVRDDLDAEDCSRAFPDVTPPTLDLGIAVRAAVFNPGDPLIFRLKASFDAMVVCSAASADEAAATHPMELTRGGGALRLMANVMAMAPQRGSPRLVAPEAPGVYRVACAAVDHDTWTLFETATDQDPAAREAELVTAFADMRGAAQASATVDVTVAE